MKVAGVGFCCADVYEKLNLSYPTGNSLDFAIHVSRLGAEASVVSVVGKDVYGDQMIKVLSRENINVSHLHQVDGQTARIQMELVENDRVHGEEEEGVMAQFVLSEEDKAFICTHDYMHTDLFGRVLDTLPFFKEHG